MPAHNLHFFVHPLLLCQQQKVTQTGEFPGSKPPRRNRVVHGFGKVPDRWAALLTYPLARGTQWELNLHKARGTWPVRLEGGEEAIFIALA